MNPPAELPVRVVGSRLKTVWDRHAEIVRNGRPFWHGRPKGVEVLQADGSWRPYERKARRNAPAHD